MLPESLVQKPERRLDNHLMDLFEMGLRQYQELSHTLSRRDFRIIEYLSQACFHQIGTKRLKHQLAPGVFQTLMQQHPRHGRYTDSLRSGD